MRPQDEEEAVTKLSELKIIPLGSDAAELVFHVGGETTGQIITFSSRSKIIGKPDLQHKETYEKTSSAIGRIFVKFNVLGKPTWICGTGFCVKQNLIMTAAHVIAYPVDTNASKETQEMQKKLKYEEIYIYFGVDASIGNEIDLTNIGMEKMHELKSCGRDFDNSFRDPLIFSDDTGQSYSWDTPNDIEVLEFKGTPPTNIGILFPMIPTNDIEIDHYVMGYPGLLDLEKFKIDYKETNENLETLYINVSKESRGFERKTVSIGKVTKSKDNVISHRCPTLKGASGGIFAISQHERKFVGVHLGGAQKTGNIALSVTHPLFWHVYQNFVLDDQFIKDNFENLQHYLNHFNYISSSTTTSISMEPRVEEITQAISNLVIIPLSSDSLERVFHENGQTIGQIITFNSKSKIGKSDFQNKESYENTSSAVGRIFVKYNVIGEKEPVWCSGTGFYVKNNLVMTAAHVIAYPVDTKAPKETQEMQRNLEYDKIYIYFGVDASIGNEIDLKNIDTEEMYELESCGRDYDYAFNDSFIVNDLNDQPYSWHTRNDLEVLRFKGTPPTDIDIIFPMIPADDKEIDHYVMGYPGHIELEKFISDYQGTAENLETLFINVNRESRGFQRKTVSIGKVTRVDDKVISHRCPTLKGASGGILAISQHERKFVGVHLGGTEETGNIALSVTHPLFWHVYKTLVLDDQFIQDNLQHLQHYLNHFNYTPSTLASTTITLSGDQ
ncbi:hypothetical protein PPL_06842 [Heterostelium album PN500]|uniref:Serine protease n=1 Tax=Heterostelium pallidum (strain ATCC 26659 / Pp 5 / PN500) TaxID=670386 RepID=D3BDP0_HETP5|nr:hypothetical protein PPL_06842 [Heterostelium album PN500]EFA80021.1 hypothetical protein PPL_06842 [Heterostelium album PN500]|eukprot:XP_020432141.1 hypothetical protein PPL_06842 [Heterostelium album PN500]